MTVAVHPEAEIEFWESVQFYEGEEAGVGVGFSDEVHEALMRISKHPELPRLRRDFYRRVNLKRFNHYIAYLIRDEEIRVLAISHAHRAPEHWIDRAEP